MGTTSSNNDASSEHAQRSGRYQGLFSTLLTGVVVQGLGALAGILVLPLLTDELGSAEFGVLIVVVSFAPWLALLYSALSPVVRILVGESRGREVAAEAPPDILRSGVRWSILIVVVTLVVWVGLVYVLPLEQLLGASGTGLTRTDLIYSVLAFSIPVILGGLGSAYTGALDGVGRNAAAVALESLGPIVALPLTLFAISQEANLIVLCGVQGLSWAIGRLAPLVWWLFRPSLAKNQPKSAPARIRFRLVMQMAWIVAASTAQTGFDPIIVSSQIGADPAASFGIANRLVQGAMIPLVILAPYFMSSMAAARGAGWSRSNSNNLRTLLAQAAGLGVLAGVALVLLGPWFGSFLGSGNVPAPQSLYLAAGAVVVASFTIAPLQWVLVGPAALRVSVPTQSVMMISNVGLSLWLANLWGPAGPFWATAMVYSIGSIALLLAIRARPTLLRHRHS